MQVRNEFLRDQPAEKQFGVRKFVERPFKTGSPLPDITSLKLVRRWYKTHQRDCPGRAESCDFMEIRF
jgi:hypothetical protein